MKRNKGSLRNKGAFLRMLLLITLIVMSAPGWAKQKKILVFSKTAGYRHGAAIEAGKKAFMKFGTDNKFGVDTTENPELFTPDNLKQYTAVVFLCTTGNVLNDQQQQAFEQFIKAGGGYMGLHSAADTEYDWPWFGELNGGYFKSHPKQQEAVFNIVDTTNIATSHLPKVWKRFDELYNFKWLGTDLHYLITIDENSYNGGENGQFHPMSWYHTFEGGRAFYTALGHDNRSYEDPLYLEHILGGLKYVMGANSVARLYSSKK